MLAYVRKKALNPGRKIECTRARMMGKSPDVQFGIWFSACNVGAKMIGDGFKFLCSVGWVEMVWV